ncbi:hypothetical protein OH492_21825 [Vibrio chagasii]|nr:hypothetical protein [Vibrio chagasii]
MAATNRYMCAVAPQEFNCKGFVVAQWHQHQRTLSLFLYGNISGTTKNSPFDTCSFHVLFCRFYLSPFVAFDDPSSYVKRTLVHPFLASIPLDTISNEAGFSQAFSNKLINRLSSTIKNGLPERVFFACELSFILEGGSSWAYNSCYKAAS